MTGIENLAAGEISESHLLNLVIAKVSEGEKTLEFKQELKIGTDGDKKEFCTDVISFANAIGGLMLYGIRADNGIAVEVFGLSISDADSLILQVDQILNSGISPRLPWVNFQIVPLANGRSVFAIKIPRSTIAPHAAGRDGSFRFFTRGSNGKLPMDIPQVRSSFLLSEGLRNRLRAYRAERTGRIIANDGIVPLFSGAKLIIQLVPLISLADPVEYEVSRFHPFQQKDLVALGCQNSFGREYNVDGIADIYRAANATECSGYTQLYQNGILEGVDSDIVISNNDERYNNCINAQYLHGNMLMGIERFISIVKILGIETPIFLLISLVGIKGTRLFYSNFHALPKKCERDSIMLQDIIITDLKCNLPNAMKSAFDSIWRGFGAPKCQWYNADGTYLVPPL